MINVEVTGGICGFLTRIQADKDDKKKYHARCRIESQCPGWNKVNNALGNEPLDVMAELFKNRETGRVHSRVLDAAGQFVPHVSCPVVSGLLKALEASVGLALPKDAAIKFID